MKLAASNIGWAPEKTSEMLPRLAEHGAEALVIAPSMALGTEGPYASDEVISDFRSRVEDAGLYIAGLQSLVYGLEGGSLFGNWQERGVLTEHLKRQAELAGKLSTRETPISLVFGSPNLRQGVIDQDAAAGVFRSVAETAYDNNARLAIEPLSGYGNQFITTSKQGVHLVHQVFHPGFGVHLDAAAIHEQEGVDAYEDFIKAMDMLHVQAAGTTTVLSYDASAPNLEPLMVHPEVPHGKISLAMNDSDYNGIVSLEMRRPAATDTESPEDRYLRELDFVRSVYIDPYVTH